CGGGIFDKKISDNKASDNKDSDVSVFYGLNDYDYYTKLDFRKYVVQQHVEGSVKHFLHCERAENRYFIPVFCLAFDRPFCIPKKIKKMSDGDSFKKYEADLENNSVFFNCIVLQYCGFKNNKLLFKGIISSSYIDFNQAEKIRNLIDQGKENIFLNDDFWKLLNSDSRIGIFEYDENKEFTFTDEKFPEGRSITKFNDISTLYLKSGADSELIMREPEINGKVKNAVIIKDLISNKTEIITDEEITDEERKLLEENSEEKKDIISKLKLGNAGNGYFYIEQEYSDDTHKIFVSFGLNCDGFFEKYESEGYVIEFGIVPCTGEKYILVNSSEYNPTSEAGKILFESKVGLAEYFMALQKSEANFFFKEMIDKTEKFIEKYSGISHAENLHSAKEVLSAATEKNRKKMLSDNFADTSVQHDANTSKERKTDEELLKKVAEAKTTRDNMLYDTAGYAYPTFVLMGDPGVGKTTAARNIAELFGYGRYDLLIKGVSDLKGHYLGHTEERVKELLLDAVDHKKAIVIDEAYSLFNDDFGREAAEILIPIISGDIKELKWQKELSNKSGDHENRELKFSQDKPVPLIIFTGYEAAMRDMLNNN
ncbi:MAG: AAA family ATPase, partial [Firmicutes bacterium]|nr:AAA family ATPase [Bacillota bacterium]